jgi:transposase, IS5 family
MEYLAGRNGDANNAILAAVGYNFRRLIRWLTPLFFLVLVARRPPPKSAAV